MFKVTIVVFCLPAFRMIAAKINLRVSSITTEGPQIALLGAEIESLQPEMTCMKGIPTPAPLDQKNQFLSIIALLTTNSE